MRTTCTLPLDLPLVNSLSLVPLMKSSKFTLGLNIVLTSDLNSCK